MTRKRTVLIFLIIFLTSSSLISNHLAAADQKSHSPSFAESFSSYFSFNFKNFFIAEASKQNRTLWCGAGNKAENCDDLGTYNETDACCREHDMCPYAFSSVQPNYNGFDLGAGVTLSHCECDSIFYSCLHEKPYKENSYVIWTSYESLNVKCFAYLPCNSCSNHTSYDNIWTAKDHRQIGQCYQDSFAVMVFDSIFDYYEYLDTNLNKNQLMRVRDMLKNNVDSFISIKKKIQHCYSNFTYLPSKLAHNYESRFLTDSNSSDADNILFASSIESQNAEDIKKDASSNEKHDELTVLALTNEKAQKLLSNDKDDHLTIRKAEAKLINSDSKSDFLKSIEELKTTYMKIYIFGIVLIASLGLIIILSVKLYLRKLKSAYVRTENKLLF